MNAQVLTSVAIYRREVGASLERVWENALDWEHLPWLHASTFSDIERLDSGDWGWRARVGLQPATAGQEIQLELLVDRPKGEYVVRTLDGPGVGTEIWTRLQSPGGERTKIEVEFQVPDVEPGAAEAIGAAYTRLYTQLWDEDESMMTRREAELAVVGARSGDGREQVELGLLDEVHARLPLVVDANGRRYRVVAVDGELLAHSTTCPHMLGPLADAQVEGGCIRCPWHGYRFDLRTGRSADGRGLRLPPAPRVRVDPDTHAVRLVWK